MRIQYASDLHLEFRENSSFLKHNPLAVAGEVLVLAGDIGYIGDENYSRHPFWDWASGNYSRVIVVPGNHEFYKMFDIDKLYNGWSLKIRENITCHYNAVIPLGNDIELIATTLWSHILLQDAYEQNLIRGNKIGQIKKIIEQRKKSGKGLRSRAHQHKPLSPADLNKIYEQEISKKRLLIRKADKVESTLIFLIESFKKLLADSNFANLLKAENLEKLPQFISEKVNQDV